MGVKLFDEFSFLHFSMGAVSQYWDITLKNLIIIHTVFELLENTPQGMKYINQSFKYWPGGKNRADTPLNMVGDTISVMLGWMAARGVRGSDLKNLI